MLVLSSMSSFNILAIPYTKIEPQKRSTIVKFSITKLSSQQKPNFKTCKSDEMTEEIYISWLVQSNII